MTSGLKCRLIPVLLLQNGSLIRSERFRTHQIVGNPLNEVRRFNEWNVDEIVYLDITRGERAPQRADHKVRGFDDRMTLLRAVSEECFIPLTWGGGIRSVDDMRECLRNGADKIAVNTAAVRDPRGIITAGAREFGSQAIVVSIDVFRHEDGTPEVYTDGGREPTGYDPIGWACTAELCGAGEILLQSVDRDGTGRGYDLDLIRSVAEAVTIPVIACGGVGSFDHYAEGVKAGASAVAAANIWHFKEMPDRAGKRALAAAGVPVRPVWGE